MAAIGVLVDVDSQKIQTIADAFANRCRVFADAAGKYQGVQAAEGGGERTDPFLCLVAKQRKGLRSSRIARFSIKQIPDIGASLRDSEQARFMVDHGPKLHRGHRIRQRKIAHEPRIQVPRSSAHDQTGCRRKPHAGIDASAVLHGREAGAAAQVGQYDAALRAGGIAETRQFLHQKRIRQAMKAIALNALRGVAARNRQLPGNERHASMKRGVEANDLRQFSVAMPQSLDEFELARQVLGIERNDVLQLVQQLLRDEFGRRVQHAMHHTMPDAVDGLEPWLRFQPIDQKIDGRDVFLVLNLDVGWRGVDPLLDSQARVAAADALHFPLQQTPRRSARLKDGEANTRGATIDRQYIGHRLVTLTRLRFLGPNNASSRTNTYIPAHAPGSRRHTIDHQVAPNRLSSRRKHKCHTFTPSFGSIIRRRPLGSSHRPSRRIR
jgi:hypothetical protein